MMKDPDNPFYSAALAYQTTAAMIAAIKLDIFTIIGAGTKSADRLSLETGASARGLRILCDYLTVIGMLAKVNAGYTLTQASKWYLDAESPMAMGGTIDFLAAPEQVSLLLSDPVSYVRNGGSAGLANLSPDHPIWVRFAKSVPPLAAPTAKRVARYVASLPEMPRTVLDLAAGHGLYGIEVAKACPTTSITAIDWPSVLTVASANASSAGIADRYNTISGDVFDVEWSGDFDLVLLPNLLHHFGKKDCVRLLQKVRRSLSAMGTALIIEFVPNEDRVSPPIPAMFAFWMLASTPEGDAYTLSDYEAMASQAGFGLVTAKPLRPTPQTLVVYQQ